MGGRNRKKSVKTAKHTKHKQFKSKKVKAAICHLCEQKLQGVEGSRFKGSRSQRIPTALFAGILCNKCRRKSLEQAIKVKIGIKKFSDTNILLRPYIDTLVKRL